MAILVCGGAGYIGSHAVVELLKKVKDIAVIKIWKILLMNCLRESHDDLICNIIKGNLFGF